jgi:hypothetical protein
MSDTEEPMPVAVDAVYDKGVESTQQPAAPVEEAVVEQTPEAAQTPAKDSSSSSEDDEEDGALERRLALIRATKLKKAQAKKQQNLQRLAAASTSSSVSTPISVNSTSSSSAPQDRRTFFQIKEDNIRKKLAEQEELLKKKRAKNLARIQQENIDVDLNNWTGLDEFSLPPLDMGRLPFDKDLALADDDFIAKTRARLGIGEFEADDEFEGIVFDDVSTAELDSIVGGIRNGLAQPLRGVDKLRKKFEETTESEEVLIGSLDFEGVKREEAGMENLRIKAVRSDLKDRKRRDMAMAIKEAAIRESIIERKRNAYFELQKRDNQALQSQRVQNKAEQAYHKKSEDQLKKELLGKKGVVVTQYGDLSESNIKDVYGTIKSKQMTVSYLHAPRVVRIRIDWLRAVKNKLPRGHYAVMCSLYDRLGGHPLYWTKLRDDIGYTGSTPFPQFHDGRFYSLDLAFNQAENRIFLACPAQSQTRPSMCFVFELFLIADGEVVKRDKVVAWGAFPMAYSNLKMAQGKFKVPMMRGGIAKEGIGRLDKYGLMEKSLAHNLDSWMGNMYFDVRALGTYQDNQLRSHVAMEHKRFDVEEVAKEDAEAKSKAEDGDKSHDALDAHFTASARPQAGTDALSSVRESEREEKEEKEESKGLNHTSLHRIDSGLVSDEEDDAVSKRLIPTGALGSDAMVVTRDGKSQSFAHMSKGRQSIVTLNDEDERRRLARDAAAEKAEAQRLLEQERKKKNGFFIDVHRTELDTLGSFRDSADSAAELQRLKKSTLTPLDPVARKAVLDQYHYGLEHGEGQNAGAGEMSVKEDGGLELKKKLYNEKWNYVKSELLADLSYKRYHTLEFWSTLTLLCVTIWFSVFTHYLGEWLALSSMKVPIYTVESRLLTVNLNYSTDNVDVSAEIVVFVAGTLLNLFIFSFMVAAVYTLQRTLHIVPDLLSRLMFCLGVAALADPYFTLLVDLVVYQNFNGDFFKLYNMYLRDEGSGLIGIALNTVILVGFFLISSIVFYFYLIRLHMNGRVMDVHYRLTGKDGDFYLPEDMEMSLASLSAIIEKSKLWHDSTGATMKIAVTKFAVQDLLAKDSEEEQAVTYHVALVKQNVKGERELHRHFIRTPDGTIVEVFDSLDLGSKQYQDLEQRLIKDAQDAQEAHARVGKFVVRR